jgi:hypothetical protein
MLAYLQVMVDALHDAPGCGATALRQVQILTDSKTHGGPAEGPHSFAPAADNNDADGGRVNLMKRLASSILTYSFWEFVEANSAMPQNCFFKNSGHVIGTPRSKGVPTSTEGQDLYSLGYTDCQLDTIYDHILQQFVWVDHASSEYDAEFPVYSGEYTEATRFVRAPDAAEASGKGQTCHKTMVYLRRVTFDMIKAKATELNLDPHEYHPQIVAALGARSQWNFISQKDRQGEGEPPQGNTATSDFTWQHIPFNGAPKDYSNNATNPVPMGPSTNGEPWDLPAASVASRSAVSKAQPQLYWDFAEDSEYMLMWFNALTERILSSALSKPEADIRDFPMVQGLYINYPDSRYIKMYPSGDSGLENVNQWPFLMYGQNGADKAVGDRTLSTLMKVKGMFDPCRNFDLASRKYNQTVDQATPALSIPFPTMRPRPYDSPPPEGASGKEKSRFAALLLYLFVLTVLSASRSGEMLAWLLGFKNPATPT